MLQTNWKGKCFVSIYFTVGHNPQQRSSCLFCHSGNPGFPAVKEYLTSKYTDGNRSVFSTRLLLNIQQDAKTNAKLLAKCRNTAWKTSEEIIV